MTQMFISPLLQHGNVSDTLLVSKTPQRARQGHHASLVLSTSGAQVVTLFNEGYEITGKFCVTIAFQSEPLSLAGIFHLDVCNGGESDAYVCLEDIAENGG